MTVVPDYSALVAKTVTTHVKKGGEVIIPVSVMALIEQDMKKNRADGFVGMEELRQLKQLEHEKKIGLRFAGMKPRILEKLTKLDADWDARDIALAEGATLVTCDEVQAKLGEIMGLDVIFLKRDEHAKLEIAQFFDETTMSIHVKEGLQVFCKKGTPGSWDFIAITDKPLKKEKVDKLARDIIEKSGRNPDAFIEIDKEGATVVQYENYRIVIARPPFSRGIEITAVRPVVKLSLEDYKLPQELMERFESGAGGIVIAGAPGAGKTTFAQALAEFYAAKKKIVKTIEHPRDLSVNPMITQYGHLEDDPEATGDVLLLVRPDFTVYDELRNTKDFEVYSDMRLAGVGMIGVTHASRSIDAIQRFLGRLDLGVIPQIVDTVLFLQGGEIKKVYELSITVKVPSGMMEADLARPVVEIKDFLTRKLEFEIYTFGESTTILPVTEGMTENPVMKLAAEEIKRKIQHIVPGSNIDVEMVGDRSARIWTDEDMVPRLIGKRGKTVDELEKQLGIGLDIRSLADKGQSKGQGKTIQFDLSETKTTLNFFFEKKYHGQHVEFYVDGQSVFSASISKKGKIKLGKRTDIGKMISHAISHNERFEIKA